MKYPKWDRTNAFSTAADFLLDILERDFGMTAPNGRGQTKAALVEMLEFFAVPKDGPDGTTRAEKIFKAGQN